MNRIAMSKDTPSLVTMSKPGVDVKMASPGECIVYQMPLPEFLVMLDAALSPNGRSSRPIKERLAILESEVAQFERRYAWSIQDIQRRVTDWMKDAYERGQTQAKQRRLF